MAALLAVLIALTGLASPNATSGNGPPGAPASYGNGPPGAPASTDDMSGSGPPG
jgi:hypothetical protein